MVILYGLNNSFFERNFFFNEILSCIGIIVFLANGVNKKFNLYIPKSDLFKMLFLFWGICGVHLIASVFLKTNWYFYFRNSVIFYSSFTFFIGFYWHKEFKHFLFRIRKFLVVAILGLMPTRNLVLLDRFSAAVFFPFFFKKGIFFTTLFILLLNFLYAYFFASMTAALIGIILIGIILLPKYAYFQLAFISIFLTVAVVFASLAPSLKLYQENSESHRLFGNVKAVYQSNKLLQIDGNSSWRTILWYRVIVDEFPKNIWGLGFGTPLLKYKPNAKTVESDHHDEHDAHVIGVHNTYITLFARLGILVLLFFYVVYTFVLKEFYYFRSFYQKSQDYTIFLAFFTISIIGLFNLVLESPIYAGLYWFLLGLLAKAIFERRKQYANITSSQ